jgi:hypothetical protein
VLKKTITYEDFNGDEVSEDFFFHLSKVEIVELQVSHHGGLSEALKRIMDAEDEKALIDEFQKIILMSIGRRSADGRRFIKNDDIREEFKSSKAYEALFMELITDTDAAIAFTTGIVPADLSTEAAKAVGIDPAKTPIIVAVSDHEPKVLTKAELVEMSKEDLADLGDKLSSGEVNWPNKFAEKTYL